MYTKKYKSTTNRKFVLKRSFTNYAQVTDFNAGPCGQKPYLSAQVKYEF